MIDAEKMSAMFIKFDIDGSGTIEYSEFVQVVRSMLQLPAGDTSLTNDRLQSMWRPDADLAMTLVLLSIGNLMI